MTDISSLPESEWSHYVEIDTMEDKRTELSISPDEDQKAALARRLNILSIENLRADIVVEKGEGGFHVHVSGMLHAEITQSCAITDEPVKAVIAEPFEGWFADPERAVSLTQAKAKMMQKKGHAEMPITDERDDPESMEDGHVDVGELAAQYLSLSINPYPHAEGAVSELHDGQIHSEEAADERKNPFAALKDWKARHGSGDGGGSAEGEE